MPRRWLPIFCAAVLAAACGSSSGSDRTSSDHTATASPTATPTVHSAGLQRLPRAQKTANNSDAGGGTRTPDTRIMIPLL